MSITRGRKFEMFARKTWVRVINMTPNFS